MSVYVVPPAFAEDYRNSICLQEEWVPAIPENGRYSHISDTHIYLQANKSMDVPARNMKIPEYLRLIRSHLEQIVPGFFEFEPIPILKKLNAQQIRSVRAHNAIVIPIFPIVLGVPLVVLAVAFAVEGVFPMGIILFAVFGTLCVGVGSVGIYFTRRIKKQCVEEGNRLAILLKNYLKENTVIADRLDAEGELMEIRDRWDRVVGGWCLRICPDGSEEYYSSRPLNHIPWRERRKPKKKTL